MKCADFETLNYQIKTKVDMKYELKITDEHGNKLEAMMITWRD